MTTRRRFAGSGRFRCNAPFDGAELMDPKQADEVARAARILADHARRVAAAKRSQHHARHIAALRADIALHGPSVSPPATRGDQHGPTT